MTFPSWTNNEKIIEKYSKAAESYDAWYEQEEALFAAEVASVKSLLGEDNSQVLEVGAGTGRFQKALGIGYGLEPAAGMREIALKRGLEVVAGYAEDLPFSEQSFRAVAFLTSLEFVAQQEQGLLEARRVLEPEGKLVIAYLDKSTTYGKGLLAEQDKAESFYYQARLHDLKSLQALLESQGFVCTELVQVVLTQAGYELKRNEFQEEAIYSVVAANLA